MYTTNCTILARTSNNRLRKYWGDRLMFLKEEKIWSSDIILFTLSWFTNWPTSILLWNYFVSAKWNELATAFLLIQSNAWNVYWGLAVNLSSQYFSLRVWGYHRNFFFLIKVVSSCRTVFRKCKCFPIRFRSKRSKNLTFTRCYNNNFSRRYAWPINIIHDSWKRCRTLLQSSFVKFIIALCIIITISLILLLDSLVFPSVRSFHNTESGCSLRSPHSLSINSNITAKWINLC